MVDTVGVRGGFSALASTRAGASEQFGGAGASSRAAQRSGPGLVSESATGSIISAFRTDSGIGRTASWSGEAPALFGNPIFTDHSAVSTLSQAAGHY